MYKEIVRKNDSIKQLKNMGNRTFPVISVFYLYMLFKRY